MGAIGDEPTTRPTGVVTALAKVMGELPGIGKGDKSPQGYSYRGIEAITKHLQPLLAKHGVVIVPNATIQRVEHSPDMKPSWQDVYLTVQWDIYGPDGSKITACTTGIGRDNADKGANKGQTQAYKYLLLHLFCIADTQDDSDGASYDHGRAPDEPTYSAAALELYARVRSTAGSPLADELKALAAENNRKLTVAALDGDPKWAELVTAHLDAAGVAR